MLLLLCLICVSLCVLSGQPSESGEFPLSLPLRAAPLQAQQQRCTEILVRSHHSVSVLTPHYKTFVSLCRDKAYA